VPFTAAQLTRILSQSPHPVKRLWVAFSGGLDSHVLLHRLVDLRDELPHIAGTIHIHHDLSDHADAWARHCEEICQQLGIACEISRVNISEGEGLEDSARRARYTAIEGYLQPGDAVLLAHHQDDQAETFLLQALRGGGPRGLASMPVIATFGAGYQIRPLLDISRKQIQEYALQHELQWIEDESNRDTRFDRNFVRHEIMPQLRQRWPSASRTLARTAAHTAGLVHIADELLQDELQDVTGSRSATLSIQALKKLPFARASLLIRAMCYQQQLPVPATSHIHELLDKQLHADVDRQIHISWSGAEFRRYRDDLYIHSPLPPVSKTAWRHDWDGKRVLEIPELGGNLRLEPCNAQGISHQLLEKGLIIKPRSGSERCQPAGDKHRRDLKTIYQHHEVPPWERERLPLIYAGDELIAIADIVVCEQALAARDEVGYKVIWQKNQPS